MRRPDAELPDRWLFLPIDDANVRITSFHGLMESTSEAAPVSGPLTIDTWLAGANGDASGHWFQSLAAELAFPKMFVWGQLAAAARVDAAAARAYFADGNDPGTNLGRAATAQVWGGGALVDAWPAQPDEDEYSRMRTSDVETLVIGGELDGTTPPQIATRELMPYLPNGDQVVLRGLGHTVDFWSAQPEASSRLINAYLDSGTVDDSLYTPVKVDFSPTVTLGTMAKIVLGSMLLLVALAAATLLWTARRRGRLGRKATIALRSLAPVVLGLGGWVLGALVAVTALPGVPLDDPLLAALAVGLPVGLGIYLAWVGRGRTGRARTSGLVAAAAGGLLGAWLGFEATGSVAGVLTATAGAIAGANLLVLVLDIHRDRAAREVADAAPAGAPAPAQG
jgi:hypothetical protein